MYILLSVPVVVDTEVELTFITLWANSTDDSIFLIFPRKEDLTFIQIVLHEMSKSVFWEK